MGTAMLNCANGCRFNVKRLCHRPLTFTCCKSRSYLEYIFIRQFCIMVCNPAWNISDQRHRVLLSARLSPFSNFINRIHRTCSRKNVLWIHAPGIVTRVQTALAGAEHSTCNHKRNSVSGATPSTTLKMPIPKTMLGRFPWPTFIVASLVHFCPEISQLQWS